MKTITQLKKIVFSYILFFIGIFCFGQTTTINATLANPCANLNVAQVNQSINFTIYPNPNNGLVNIHLNKSYFDGKPKVKVHDVLGKLIYEKNDFENNPLYSYILRLDNLTSGIYFVTVQIKETITTKKLIIKK